MRKKVIALFTTLCILLSVVIVGLSVSASTNGKTADQAIDWCDNQVGHTLEEDGSRPTDGTYAQCIDLIKGYMKFLGVQPTALGDASAYAGSNAKQFFANHGWTQIQGAQPQKGDILVYTGGYKERGHVAIYASDYVHYHQRYYSSHDYVEKKTNFKYNNSNYFTYTYEGKTYTNTYWGVIRPDFSPVPPDDDNGKPMTVGAGRTIPDGDYWIASGVKQDYFLDVPGDTGNVSSKTNVQTWQWGNNMPSEADVYSFQYQNNGFYKIIHKSSGLALDVYGAELKAGTNVWLFTNYEHDAQLWSVSVTNGGFKIQSKCNSWFLDVTGATYANGTNVQVWKGNDSVAQKFGLIPYKPNQKPFENGIYTIHQSANSNYYLDTQGYNGEYGNGSNVQLFTYANDNDLDKYKFEYAGNGYYYITNCTYEGSKNLRVEQVEDSSSFLATTKNIDVREPSNSRGQLWMITQESDGSYRFWNKLNGYCLDSTGGVLKDRNNIQAYTYNTSAAQKWIIRRVQKDISSCTVTVSPTSYTYDGTAKTPTVTVKDGTTTLKSGTDFTVSYSNNINVGTATVSISGKGNYKGSVTKYFTISKPAELVCNFTSSLGTDLSVRNKTILNAEVINGTGNYQYKFIVYNENTNQWYKIKDFGSENAVEWYTGPAGKKTLYVDVKDTSGNVKRFELKVNVTSTLSITSFTSSNGQNLNSKSYTTLTAIATGGKSPYLYKFIVYNNTTKQWYKLRDFESTNTFDWYTGPKGEKTLYVDVKDSDGSIVRMELVATVS